MHDTHTLNLPYLVEHVLLEGQGWSPYHPAPIAHSGLRFETVKT